jgi:hypothetical protein
MKPSNPLCCLLMIVSFGVATAVAADAPLLAPEQALQQSRAKYAAMSSYSDAGSVVTSYKSGAAPADVETHTFHTYYHTPRQFYLEFRKGMDTTERFVIWSEGQDFNTWWSETQVHEDYPQGQGATAFALGALPTQGAVVMIPPLLFSKAGLQGPLANFTLAKGDGTEPVGGHRCYRLLGREALAYGTGTVTGERSVIVWIDTESLLVRKVFEDTPPDMGGGTVSTITTTLDPVANPSIDPSHFHFDVPKS